MKNTGWICPNCKGSNAPSVAQCPSAQCRPQTQQVPLVPGPSHPIPPWKPNQINPFDYPDYPPKVWTVTGDACDD